MEKIGREFSLYLPLPHDTETNLTAADSLLRGLELTSSGHLLNEFPDGPGAD